MRRRPRAELVLAITGASGGLGSRVLAHLLDSWREPRRLIACARNPAALAYLRDAGINVRAGDYDEPRQMVRAFEGVDHVLLISSDGNGDRVSAQHRTVIDAAASTGVQEITYTSIVDIDPYSCFYFAGVHAQTEEYLARTGVRHRILRNGLYADLLLSLLQDARSTGQLSLPLEPDACVAAIMRDDLARAYVPLLMESAAEGKVEILTGNRVFSFEEIVEIFGTILGRRVRFERIGHRVYLERLWRKGTPDWLTHALHTLWMAIAEGRFAVTNNRIEELTGRAPRPLADSLLRLAKDTADPVHRSKHPPESSSGAQRPGHEGR